MQFVLSVIGAITIIILCGLLVGYLWLKHKLRQLMDYPQIGTALEISLVEEPEPEWDDSQHVARKTQEFQSFGFSILGTYRVPKINDALMCVLHRPDDQVTAIITELPGAPAYEEVGVMFTDGTAIDCTNSHLCGHLDNRPGQDKINLVGAEIPELLQALHEYDDLDRQREAQNAENFVQFFEDAYLKDSAWQFRRGGPTKAEIRKISQATGSEEVSDEVIDESYLVQREQCREACREYIVKIWAEQNGVSASTLYEMDELPVVINEFMTRDEVIEVLTDEWDLNMNQIQAIQALGDSDDLIALNFNQKFFEIFPDTHFSLVADIKEPIPARVYARNDVLANAA